MLLIGLTLSAPNPKLVQSIIQVESDWDKSAVSPMGARGLMQVMPKVAANLRKLYGDKCKLNNRGTNLLHPKTNIRYGTCLLKELRKTYKGNLRLMLIAYNGGGNAVQKFKKYGMSKVNKETREYVPKVLKLYYGKSVCK